MYAAEIGAGQRPPSSGSEGDREAGSEFAREQIIGRRTALDLRRLKADFRGLSPPAQAAAIQALLETRDLILAGLAAGLEEFAAILAAGGAADLNGRMPSCYVRFERYDPSSAETQAGTAFFNQIATERRALDLTGLPRRFLALPVASQKLAIEIGDIADTLMAGIVRGLGHIAGVLRPTDDHLPGAS